MWDEGVADVITIALDQLRGIPYILMVPGEGSRTIWPSLANRHLGRPRAPDGRVNGKLPLPGPARKPPAAVVRVTPMPGGIRPVPGAANPKTPKTINALYEHDHTGEDAVLVLSTVPRQYDGSGRQRRVGSDHSRWTAHPAEQPLTWYAHTCPEFLVRGTAEGHAQQYGIDIL
jgi:RNaseH domain of pPIWI_RE